MLVCVESALVAGSFCRGDYRTWWGQGFWSHVRQFPSLAELLFTSFYNGLAPGILIYFLFTKASVGSPPYWQFWIFLACWLTALVGLWRNWPWQLRYSFYLLAWFWGYHLRYFLEPGVVSSDITDSYVCGALAATLLLAHGLTWWRSARRATDSSGASTRAA